MAAPPADVQRLLIDFVADQLARVTRVDRARIDPRTSFFMTGFDSLMALELRNRLQTGLRVKLTAGEVMARPSVVAIAELLETRLVADGPAAHALAEPPVPVTSSPSEPSRWVRVLTPRPQAKVRLFCFPYAGGAASVFAGWQDLLSADIEVCAIQLPARQERLGEPALQSVAEIAAGLVPALLPLLDRPFAAFGHCLGAIVMFEALRELGVQHERHALVAFAAGAPPPDRYFAPSVTRGSAAEFRDVLQFIGFARREVLEDEDAERDLLAPVRADFDVAARYRYTDGAPLAAPLVTFAGREDPFAPPDIVRDWRAQTMSRASHVTFPGGHYFIVPEREALVRVLEQEVRLRLAAAEGGMARVRLLRARESNDRTAIRLFAFPGLGADGSQFADLAPRLDGRIELRVIELPGRGSGSDHLPLGTVEHMVASVLPSLRESLDMPYALVGIDIGSIVLFELVRRLRGERRPLPRHVFVGAAMAPHQCYLAALHHLSRERLLETVRNFGVEVAETREAEAALRGDCAAAADYTYSDEVPLDAPITVFMGDRDRFIPRASAEAWERHTVAGFEFVDCPSGHDVFAGRSADVVAEVVQARLALERNSSFEDFLARTAE